MAWRVEWEKISDDYEAKEGDIIRDIEGWGEVPKNYQKQPNDEIKDKRVDERIDGRIVTRVIQMKKVILGRERRVEVPDLIHRGWKCPKCGSEEIIVYAWGEMICKKCGKFSKN